MKIERFRYFLMVAKCGSITAAAKECYISQTAMSQQIDALERELGVRVLVRTKSGSTLTKAGELLLTRAERLVQDYDELFACMADIVPPKSLTICYTGPLEQTLILNAVPLFSKLHPDVDVIIRQRAIAELLSAFEHGMCDIALTLPEAITLPGFYHVAVMKRRICACISKTNPLYGRTEITLDELRKYPVVLLQPETSNNISNKIAAWLLQNGWKKNQMLYADTIEDQLLLVNLNRGISLMPEGQYQEGLCLIPIAMGEGLTHQTDAVLRRKSHLCEDMIRCLKGLQP